MKYQTINLNHGIYTITIFANAEFIDGDENELKLKGSVKPDAIGLIVDSKLRNEADFNALNEFIEFLKDRQKMMQEAVVNKFEEDFDNAGNVAEGLETAFDNLPDNFLSLEK